MGNIIYNPIVYELEDCSCNQVGYSAEMGTTDWEYTPAKNFRYYSQPATKISRKLYSEYTRGYAYGYYYQPYSNEETIDNIEVFESEEEHEREF